MLFATDLSGESIDDGLHQLMKEQLRLSSDVIEAAGQRVASIISQSKALDSLIEGAVEKYELSRIQSVERCILHLAFYEMFMDDKIPEKVAIAEALRLAKKFAAPEAVSFVNGVLAGGLKAMGGINEEESDSEQPQEEESSKDD